MKKKAKPKAPKKRKLDSSNPMYRLAFDIQPSKGDQRRVAVLEATLECIALYGIEGTNFESVGKQAGMLRAHVAYYFPDFAALIESAIKFVVANAQRITVENVMRAKTSRERLTAFIESAFEWAEKYPNHVPVVLQFYSYAATRKEYRKMHTEIRTMGAERLRAIVEAELIFNHKSPEKALSIALLIQDLMTGSLLTLGTCESRFPASDVKARVLQTAFSLVENK